MKLAPLAGGLPSLLIFLCLEAGMLVGIQGNTQLQAMMQLIACKRHLNALLQRSCLSHQQLLLSPTYVKNVINGGIFKIKQYKINQKIKEYLPQQKTTTFNNLTLYCQFTLYIGNQIRYHFNISALLK